MLAAKSTCKERWRQILTEANRIPNKHLCTLEAGISNAQTAEMQAQKVSLVIPKPILETYSPAQRLNILTLNQFVHRIKEMQR
jgi:hypothetical protein